MESFLSIDILHSMGFKSVGDNVLISSKASFYGISQISLGSNVRIDDFCVLSAGQEGIRIGRNVHIGVMSSLIGADKIELENFCTLSSRVAIYSSSDNFNGEYMISPTVPEKYTNVINGVVSLKKHVVIGSGTVILPGVTVGEGTAVGALSLISKDLEPFSIYAGNPIKLLKPTRSKRIFELEKLYLETE